MIGDPRLPRPKNELGRILRPFGISVSADEVEGWDKCKAIPADHGNMPEVYVAEVAAAAYLIERCGWNENQVMVARFHMAACIEAKENAVSKLDSFFAGGIEGKEKQYLDGMNWFFTVLKFLNELPPNGGVEVFATDIPSVGCSYATAPALEDRISSGSASVHPHQFEPPKGALVG
ncbi:MAG: hypothetical protein ACRD2P_08950 [Terriglobia bacterium]